MMATRGVHELVLHGDRHIDAWSSRQFVRQTARGFVPDATLVDMQHVTSELVTNALEHGLPKPISVIVHLRRRRASVSVASQAPTTAVIPHVSEWRAVGLNGRVGRGLALVEGLSHRVKVERWGESLCITSHFKFRHAPHVSPHQDDHDEVPAGAGAEGDQRQDSEAEHDPSHVPD